MKRGRKEKGDLIHENIFDERIEIGKRYKLSFPSKADSSPDEVFLLQYGFKPANIDPKIAHLEVSTNSQECKVTHFRSGDGEKLNFAGIQSSVQSKEFLLQFQPEEKRFTLSKVTGSFTNIRQKVEIDSVTSSKSTNDRSKDRVEERLRRMTRKVTNKSSSKPQQLSLSSTEVQEKENGVVVSLLKESEEVSASSDEKKEEVERGETDKTPD